MLFLGIQLVIIIKHNVYFFQNSSWLFSLNFASLTSPMYYRLSNVYRHTTFFQLPKITIFHTHCIPQKITPAIQFFSIAGVTFFTFINYPHKGDNLISMLVYVLYPLKNAPSISKINIRVTLIFGYLAIPRWAWYVLLVWLCIGSFWWLDIYCWFRIIDARNCF